MACVFRATRGVLTSAREAGMALAMTSIASYTVHALAVCGLRERVTASEGAETPWQAQSRRAKVSMVSCLKRVGAARASKRARKDDQVN